MSTAQYTVAYPAAQTTAPIAVPPPPTHYPNHYPNVPAQPTSTYYSPYSPTVSTPGGLAQSGLSLIAAANDMLHRQTNPAPARPPEPPEPAITPAVATQAFQRLLENELLEAGFESAESQTLNRLEIEVIAFVQQLFERAHECANLANRAGVIPSDLLFACDDFGVAPKKLYPFARKRRVQPPPTADASSNPIDPLPQPSKGKRSKRKLRTIPTKLISPASRSPSPELLPSDDETGPPVIPTTLRGLPSYLPQLPPKHTYLQTPASPPKKAALPSLEKKLKTAGLVQESLKNLLLATEDSTGQEDAELLGHIVNWEAGLHPRKRWKVGR